MIDFTFDPVKHEYWVDGIRWPSVTEFLAPLNDFSKINPAVLEKKRTFGKQIHKIVELEALGVLDENSLSDFQRIYLGHIRQWAKDYNINIGNAIGEHLMASGLFQFCGTPDLIFIGKLLVDVKTRPFKRAVDALQLAGQEILCRENFGIAGKYEQRVLSLSENGYKYPLVATPAQQKENRNRFIWLVKKWWAEGGGYSQETINQMQTWKI